jgi:hypothetical protein
MTGLRYIDIDWGDDTSHPPLWCLKVDGELVATAPVEDWRHPPFALTEGRRFVAQYHSTESFESGEPDSWIHHPPARRDVFWPSMAVVGVLLAASVRWPVALLVAFGVLGVLIAREVK